MEGDPVLSALQRALPDVELSAVPSLDAQGTVYVPASRLLDVTRTLRDHPDLQFAVLAELTAVDFWPKEPRFELVYIVVSPEKRLRFRLKLRLEGSDPRVASVASIWPAANWLEREVWDLFGIAFEGHPDLRRLLMPEDWEGFPLRKDYPVQVNVKVQTSEPIQVTEEEFRANVERDRLGRQMRR
jgi:NADH-quinone oxidoreductase subunit C